MLWKHDIFVRGMDMGEKCTHPLTMTVWVTLEDSMEVGGGGGPHQLTITGSLGDSMELCVCRGILTS